MCGRHKNVLPLSVFLLRGDSDIKRLTQSFSSGFGFKEDPLESSDPLKINYPVLNGPVRGKVTKTEPSEIILKYRNEKILQKKIN